MSRDAAALLLLGVAAGAVSGQLAARQKPDASANSYALSLLGACAVYPIARRELEAGPVAREVGALGVGAALALAVRRSAPRLAWRTVAAGWAAHSLFDLGHHRGHGSRVPDWYPPFCAGYDVGLAASLLRRA